MTTTRKVRRMARDPQPRDDEGMPAACTAPSAPTALTEQQDSQTNPQPPRVTKQSALIKMLSQEGGATLNTIVDATGWLPHTARAALTGLRKKGHAIDRFRSEEKTRYRIAASSAPASADGAVSVGDVGGASPGARSDADADAGSEAAA